MLCERETVTTYTILRLNLRTILLRPFQLRQKHIEVMLRVIVILGLGQGRRLSSMARYAGDTVRLRVGRLRVRRVGLNALTGDGGDVEASCGLRW